MSLPREFYLRPPEVVARALLGMHLCRQLPDGIVRSGRIVEVEAYGGTEDRASHAKLKRGTLEAGRPVPTQRSALMFGPVGVAYVYLIYGLHHCFNVVAHDEEGVGAVLIRALEPALPLGPASCRGPARLCVALQIDLRHNGLALAGEGADDREARSAAVVDLALVDRGTGVADEDVMASPRIGVEYAQQDALLPLRFCDRRSAWLSRPAQAPQRTRP